MIADHWMGRECIRVACSISNLRRMHRVCPQCGTQYGSDLIVCPKDGATLTDQTQVTDTLLGIVLADRYRVIRMLGEGGMGRVYLAEHVRMGRLSAVKVMSPWLAATPDAVGRFNREAANASRINHPNVAAIYDFGESSSGMLYLAMEYVDGETLAAMLRRTGPLAPAHAGELVRQIADALHAAHHLGIVHRDLKPDNILITHDADGRERVKVVDFGIAKAAPGSGQTVTTTGMSVGTPEYMSPEQLSGESLDARSDIYSLGLVAFKMLTGELAYPDVTSKQSLVQRLTARPRPLSAARPAAAWPPRLPEALDRAMSPEPHDRYGKVSDFALDVMAATGAGAPLQGRTRAMTPIGVPGITTESYEVVDDRVRRRRPLVAAGGVLAAVAAIVLLWLSRADAPGSATSTAPVVLHTDSAIAAEAVPAAAAPAPAPAISVPDTVAKPGAVNPTPLATSGAVHPSTDTTPVMTRASSDTSPRSLPPLRRAGAHAWLRASGDSSSEGLPSGTLVDEAREVLGHINRARHMINTSQLPRAGAELRTAHEEFATFAAEHPGTRETQVMRKQLAGVTREALSVCEAMRDSATVAARRVAACAPLEKFVGQQDQLGRGLFPLGKRARP